MIDSHCHLDYFEDWEDILNKSPSVEELLIPGESIKDNIFNIKSVSKKIHYAIGIHPTKIGSYSLKEVEEYMDKYQDKIIALGETGLDTYFNSVNKSNQLEFFSLHVDKAKKYSKTIIIHMRGEGINDILSILKEYSVPFVFHCYTYGLKEMRKILDLGGYISFSGILTFNKKVENIVDSCKHCPIDRILCETDSPFLSPEPFRGKENFPQRVSLVYEKVSSIKAVDIDYLKREVKNNFYKAFNLN